MAASKWSGIWWIGEWEHLRYPKFHACVRKLREGTSAYDRFSFLTGSHTVWHCLLEVPNKTLESAYASRRLAKAHAVDELSKFLAESPESVAEAADVSKA